MSIPPSTQTHTFTVLSVEHIAKSYGIHTILDGVSLNLVTGQRVGLVGANGAGKSTLLKIIAGEIEADGGIVRQFPGRRIAYLPQILTHVEGLTVADLIGRATGHIHALEAQMRELETRMASPDEPDMDAVMEAYGDALEKFEFYGGYTLEARLDEVMNGLGVGHIPRDRHYLTLSGGEKSRIGLALLLIQSADLLLLDEPTNHLDYRSLEWLEGFVNAYRGGVLIVSHDREFLNRTVNQIAELDEHSHQIKLYAGSYDAYARAKAQERERWRVDYEKQQEELKELRIMAAETARRNDNYRTHTDGDKLLMNAKIAKHESTVSKRIRWAQERIDRIIADPIPRPPDDLRFTGDFEAATLSGRFPLQASGLRKAYGERVVLRDVNFVLQDGQRVVLVGPNGAGKSTLIRLLAGEEAPDAGTVSYHPDVRLGYLKQEARIKHTSGTLFDLYSDGIDQDEQKLKALLCTRGLFRFDELDKPAAGLSSGQVRKLNIGRLIVTGANLLLLDEPTNYVSFDVLENLENALQDFPGAVIAASHDRRFIQNFGGEIWEVRDGDIIMHENWAAYSAAYSATHSATYSHSRY